MGAPGAVGRLLAQHDACAGKTTLARSLATTLEAAGARVVLSKEPTNGPWGTQLRQSAATG
ncbi:hypothetical protein XarCFBP6762_21495, partial [Xanthomonas arboricola]